MNQLTTALGALVLAACSPEAPPPPFEESFRLALETAMPGDVIEVPAGTFTFDRSLVINTDRVTIRGQGMPDVRVYDVACSDGGAPDARPHRCPDNGARVDITDCSITARAGDPKRQNLEATIQELTWSSSSWYVPSIAGD